ncbi:DUF7158 domain-containing protein [Kitasatospora camelliae]|uniref:[acyl-carrier-protein] S-malonyltransferase n=1 Tax=Kitasatospora camelliae TaxID=3156397 RepID=A0AAU8K488_9ACTN
MSGHHHGPHPAAAGVLGLLDGRPLPRAELDRRLAALRGGPRSSALPVPGSAEDRQLTRWVAQVVLTEELCAVEAAERGLDASTAPPVRLDQRAAVELGSIAAAAFEGSAAVRAVYAAVTDGVEVDPAAVERYRTAAGGQPAEPSELWRLATPDGTFDTDPAGLPTTLADALRAAGPGREVHAGGWTATLIDRRPAAAPGEDAEAALRESARRIAFVRWLDHTRATRLTILPGLEHPGDPTQPDNHHRH